MSIAIDAQPAVNEEIWIAWLQKRKQQEAATARKVKIFGGIVAGILAIGCALEFLYAT